MKVLKLGIFVFLIAQIAVGCSRQEQEISNLSGLGIEGEDKDIATQTITSTEPEAQPIIQPQPIQVEPQKAEPVSEAVNAQAPSSEEAERNKQIQTALKNANMYFGQIDGKFGPLTRKAVEEFQKMKGLKADGKVGPITWGELQKYVGDEEPKVAKPRRKDS